MLFGPTGILTSVSQSGKDPCDRLGWDGDPLIALKEKTIQCLSELYRQEEMEFLRLLWPEETMVEDPWTISFSDGSRFRTGGVAYIRWELKNGSCWSRIMLGKGKTGPKS